MADLMGSPRFILAFIFVLLSALQNIQGVDTANVKCGQVVSIESTELLSYLGNVTFTAPGAVVGNWTLAMKTSIPFTFIGGWNVMVTSTPSKGQVLFQNIDPANIHAGEKMSFRFRIRYGSQTEVPKVKSIKWNKMNICGDALSNDLNKKVALNFLDLEASTENEELEAGSGVESDNIFQRRKEESFTELNEL